jgi:hypothetical protein
VAKKIAGFFPGDWILLKATRRIPQNRALARGWNTLAVPGGKMLAQIRSAVPTKKIGLQTLPKQKKCGQFRTMGAAIC